MSFVHLHGHSTFSFLEAIGKPKQIVEKAKELGMTAIAITDYNGMCGAVDFYQKAKNEGIKPIIWVELGFVIDLDNKVRVENIWNITLLALNKQGYHNLLKLTSFANMEGLENKQKIDLNILRKHKDGVVALIWWEQSWIGKMIANREKDEKILEIISLITDILWKENTFLELNAQDYDELPIIQNINEKIIEYATQTNITLLIWNNFHYVNETDKDAREMALAIKDGFKMYDEQRRKPKGKYFIATEKDITNTMQINGYSKEQITTRIQNNQDLADRIDLKIDLYQKLFPNYETPDNIKELYEQNKEDLEIKSH